MGDIPVSLVLYTLPRILDRSAALRASELSQTIQYRIVEVLLMCARVVPLTVQKWRPSITKKGGP